MRSLLKNKRGLTTQDFVIAGLLFSGVVAFYVLAIADISLNYPDNPDIISDSFSENYDTLTTQAERIETMRKTSLTEEGLSFRGLFDVTFGSFFTIVQLVFATLNLFGSMYTNFLIDFTFIDSAVGVTFMTLGFAIITVLLVFRLINAVGRNKL